MGNGRGRHRCKGGDAPGHFIGGEDDHTLDRDSVGRSAGALGRSGAHVRSWSRPSNLRDSRGRTDCNQTAQVSVLTIIALCVGAIALSYIIWAIAAER